ncbi:putative mitochondrial protein [Vitis vinifera]|uniref:Putative mitochondrial protein n=1 Tax=Vitis vinifera TaxID=29760 RepID=A0A438CQ49_VITVI|nr:putative mitochondrial protein [Vitis vinifera]
MLGLWQDLDLNCEKEWECTGDSVRFKKKMENERAFDFLTGLNHELDDVRSRVLSRRSLPFIREVFSEVRQEENRRKVMLREHLSSGPEASALVICGPHSGSGPRQSKRTYCEHCKKLGHTKDTCGLYMASPRIGNPDSPIKPIVIRPHRNPDRQNTHRNSASDHMTDAHHLFSTYSSCAGNLKDLSSRKAIGSAKESEDLYYLDETDVCGQCPPTVCNSASRPIGTVKLLLWHKGWGEFVSEARPPLTLDYLEVVVLESTLYLISTPLPNTEGHLNLGGDTELQTNRETIVYSRRPKSKSSETLISEALKESEPVIVPTPQESGSNTDQVIDDLPIALRKQPRSCTLHPISKLVSYNAISAKCRVFTTNLDRIQIPKNIQEALEIPEWKEAMMEEIRALEKNRTWEVMTLPTEKKPVGCKWVFTVKYKADDTVKRNKARLVTKGFTQTYNIDYTETFAPVAKLNTIRVLLSLAANLDWPLPSI